jgi:hypothetical protein
MADWRADALVDVSHLAEEPGSRMPWGQLDAEINRQVDVFDLWDGRSAFVMDYRVEWLVRNHVAILHLDDERLGLLGLCACLTRVGGGTIVLGFILGGRLYRVRSFEEFWERRYLDTLRQQDQDDSSNGP